jgi:hypothetical protein
VNRRRRQMAMPFPEPVRSGRARRPPGRQSAQDARRLAHDTRPVTSRAGGQRTCRQMALRTRSRSTCRRATSRGSAALIFLASHVDARPVQAAPACRAAAGAAVRCDVTQAANVARDRLIPGPGTSFRLSPGGSSPARARCPRVAGGAGSHTRFRRGSPRGGAPGTGGRSCFLSSPRSARSARALVRMIRSG